MSVDATNLAKLTREEILADEIQRELRKDSVVWNLAKDLSSRLRPGQRYTVLPRSLARAVADIPNDGSELADNTTSYLRDRLELDKFKTVYDYVYDKDQPWSSIDLKADFFVEAPGDLAEQMEADLVAEIVAAGTTKPESAVANPNKFQLAGTGEGGANTALTLNQVSSIAKEMTKAKIPKSGRICLLSPQQAHELRQLPGIQDASQFGNNDATVNGQIAKLYGITMVESQDLTDNQVVFMHTSAIVKAMAKDVEIDEDRESKRKRTFVSVDSIYGTRVIRDGELIFFGDET